MCLCVCITISFCSRSLIIINQSAMITSCVVGGCKHRQGVHASKRRGFLRFHACPKDPEGRRKWDVRINRQIEHVAGRKTYAYLYEDKKLNALSYVNTHNNCNYNIVSILLCSFIHCVLIFIRLCKLVF